VTIALLLIGWKKSRVLLNQSGGAVSAKPYLYWYSSESHSNAWSVVQCTKPNWPDTYGSPKTSTTLLVKLRSDKKHYMTSSASGQDEPNLALWLATPSGQDGAILPARDTGFVLQGILSHIINPLSTKVVRSRWLDIGLVFFFRVLWTSTSSRSINTQKRTWPISSHLDLTLGQ